MKKYLFLAVVFLFGCSSQAQYLPEVAGYNLWVEKITEGQTMPTPDNIIKQDTTITLAWERGDGTNPPYVSPYAVTTHAVIWIPNTPELWNGTLETTSPHDVAFTEGMYEITLNEVDINENQSGRSNPLYLQFTGVYAKIPILLRFE